MRFFEQNTGVAVVAPAKVNLFLELLGKRPDGYHELASLMVGLTLADRLTFSPRHDGEVRLSADYPGLTIGPDNLIVKAAEALRRRFGATHGADIRLAKRIPIAAGLAGGSTDAAAALVGLSRLWKLRPARDDLLTLAAELGSDVAFFFALPAAWCTGRGEIVEPLTPSRALDVVLVFPPIGCSTASVYRNVVVPPRPHAGGDARAAFLAGDVDGLSRSLFNRLEAAAETVAPELRRWREAIERVAPLGCRMSGSGSTLFALARSRVEAAALARTLSTHPDLAGCRVAAVRTLIDNRSRRPWT